MTDPKRNGRLNALDEEWSYPRPWPFVRAAALANLVVATWIFAECSGIAIVWHEPKVFEMGLSLVPFVTLVVWGTAALLYVLEVAPRWLRALGQRLAARHRTSLSAGSAVWDEWLDSPGRHDR